MTGAVIALKPILRTTSKVLRVLLKYKYETRKLVRLFVVVVVVVVVIAITPFVMSSPKSHSKPGSAFSFSLLYWLLNNH